MQIQRACPLLRHAVIVAVIVGCDGWPFGPEIDARVAACPAVDHVSVPAGELRWWRGNLHTHTLWSDGDQYPEMVVQWYKTHGYQFLALTEHNNVMRREAWIDVPQNRGGWEAYQEYVSNFGLDWVERAFDGVSLQVRLKTFDEFCGLFEEPNGFLLLRGEEITDRSGSRPVHINATNLADEVIPRGGRKVWEAAQNDVDLVPLAANANEAAPLVHIAHPTLGSAFTPEDIARLHGVRFFEVYNGHPATHVQPDEQRLSTERMWDLVLAERLSRGDDPVYGIAVDDAHNYLSSSGSIPGRGWVMVRSSRLTPRSLIAAMEAGDFYASTGVTIERIGFDGKRLEIVLQAEPAVSYRTLFIGTLPDGAQRSGLAVHPDGARSAVREDGIGIVLADIEGATPTYVVRGDEIYVRAEVISSKLKANAPIAGEVEMAWTQPVLVDR